MRCEDCLPLVEEYFDGEVTGQTAGQVRAHLSTCADCSAALDALSFEQEIYARYDRGGLEVTPDLWARVSAEIARTPPAPESPAAGRPFLSRARGYFAAATAAFAARPALASSLALAVVAAAAGALWLSRRAQPGVAPQQVARNAPAPPAAASGPAVPDGNGVKETQAGATNPLNVNQNDPAPAAHEPRGAQAAANVRRGAPAGGAQTSVEDLLAESPAPKASPDVVVIAANEQPDEIEGLLVSASAPARPATAAADRLLDPAEKGVARHVERAQMLLRSIENVRASEAGDTDIAYEKTLSRQLLAENSTFQLEAEVKGDKGTKQVLDQIEPFLLEIANMGEKPSREEVRSIRERVRKNEIVAALEVY